MNLFLSHIQLERLTLKSFKILFKFLYHIICYSYKDFQSVSKYGLSLKFIQRFVKTFIFFQFLINILIIRKNAYCTNTVGSFVCSCNSGYTSHVAYEGCSDYNECAYGNYIYFNMKKNIQGVSIKSIFKEFQESLGHIFQKKFEL